MSVLLEQTLVYGAVFVFCALTVFFYLKKQKVNSLETRHKVEKAKADGLYEPVSLHPHIDLSTCIGSAACVAACPEKDILGLIDGVATVVNTSNCVGHGACFHACPVEAITLRIGTETRGVDLPHVNQNFESNIKGIFIAGELGGMGLIKNSVEQGEQAMENIAKTKKQSKDGVLDVVIVGAGPAGISATLTAKRNNLSSITLEQDSLGGTVYTFPRSKIVMTSPMNLPLTGKVKLYDTSKDELLKLWHSVIDKNNLTIHEHIKVEGILPLEDGTFKIQASKGHEYLTHNVLLAIGRRGSPRKLNIPGEDLPKVAYRLLEPENIYDKKIVVVGGGDSAVESALLLKDNNEVILSYRKDSFARIKPKNREKVQNSIDDQSLNVLFNTNLTAISANSVSIKMGSTGEIEEKNE